MSAQRSHEDEEQQALLGHRHSEGRGLLSNGKDYNSEKKGLRKRLTTSVDSSRADVPLILSFFIAGMIDAGSYNAYECFCSMQVSLALLLPTPIQSRS